MEQVFSWCLKPLRPESLPIHAARSYITFYDVFNSPGQPVLQPVLLPMVRILFLASHFASSKEILLKRLRSPSHTTVMFIDLYLCFWEYETTNVFPPCRDKLPCLGKVSGNPRWPWIPKDITPFGKSLREVFKLSLSANSFQLDSRTIVMWA